VPKKPALQGTSPSVNYQAITDEVKEVVETAVHDRGRQAEVNAFQVSNPNAKQTSKSKKPSARQSYPAASDVSPAGSSRASSSCRTVRFQDQASDQSSGQGYESSGRSRWRNRQWSSQGNGDRPRPMGNNYQPGGQGSTRRRRMDVSTGRPSFSAGFADAPPFRGRCRLCGIWGCHSRLHRDDVVLPQAPLALYCQVCGVLGCHPSCHQGNVSPPVATAPGPQMIPATVPVTSPQSLWQRGPTHRATGLRPRLYLPALKAIKDGLCLC